MAILPKEYLSFVDVGQYFNHMDLFYHLGREHDINQLRDDLWDLITEDKLEPYFYCNSYNYGFEPINTYLKLDNHVAYILLRTNREYKLGEVKVNFNNEIIDTKLLEPLDLDFYDLKFKRTDVDKLFEGELVLPSEEYLKAEVYELKEEIKLLKAQLNSHNKNTVDKELPYKSQEAVARMLYGLLKELDYDISAHSGTTNDLIVSASKSSGKPVTKTFVSDWLKLVQQVEDSKE